MAYLAHATIGAGGSWARDKNMETAIKRFTKIAFSDWGGLYDMAGKTCPVGVYDVGDHEVTMGHEGVFETDSEPRRFFEPIEVRTVTFPKRRR